MYDLASMFEEVPQVMSENYFQVVVAGRDVAELLSHIKCLEHGQHLVGSTVLRDGLIQSITRIGVKGSKVDTVALDMGAYDPNVIFGCPLTVSKRTVQALSACTPMLKAFFDAYQAQQRIVIEREALKVQVMDCTGTGNLNLARKMYEEHCADWWPIADFQDALRTEALARQFIGLLKDAPFCSIDRFYNEHLRGQLSAEELTSLKAGRLRWRLKKLDVAVDSDQERALASPFHRLQITARAGSGKTRTLAARAALAISDEKLSPNQVLILAFNKAAAAEIKGRVKKLLKGMDYENARTFHSLAYQLAKPQKKILFDSGESVSEREQSQFAQRMLRRIINPAFREEMVKFFRQELEQVESIGRDLPPHDYFAFRRSLEHVTLGGQWIRANGERVVTNGERVKSKGEKFIADFLFEHDIQYRYERAWMWKTPFLDGAIYKPDFSILANGRDYILEHWAFDPDDANAELPDCWGLTAEDYRSQIEAKRGFWASKQITLLETDAGMLVHGREAFEVKLKSILERVGIPCVRLPDSEIVARVFQNDFMISRMAGLFTQFIMRAKKHSWSPDEVSDVVRESSEKEPRTQVFHQLALRAYREYELMKSEESAMDFDDLLCEATKAVELHGSDASIHLGGGRAIALGDVKWILIDEFQDFSFLYYQLLAAILHACPHIRIVSVGDDWQAINSFAGAELKYFERFSEYFSGGETVELTTNYRSGSSIVEAGNRVMAGHGASAVVAPSAPLSLIENIDVSKVFVQFVRSPETEGAWSEDQVYLPNGTSGRVSETLLRQAQVLKTLGRLLRPAFCTATISETTRMADRSPHVLLISRTRYAYGLDLSELKERVIGILVALTGAAPNLLDRLIQVTTAHGSKGREAHTVVILDATERQFPKIHADSLLFEIFGTTQKDLLAEERRLFYVAISRATRYLFILTDKNAPSPYLQLLSTRVRPDKGDIRPVEDIPYSRGGPLVERIRALLPSM